MSALWEGGGWGLSVLLLLGGFQLAFLPKLKGNLGELGIRARLKGIAFDELHDVIVPDGRGGLTQIDHVFLTGDGIRVVETKNYSGRLFGGPRQKTWTQRIKRRSITINNPLRQNWGHTKAVTALVGNDVPVQGHVVVGNQAQFPKGVPDGVLRPGELAAYLKRGQPASRPKGEWVAAWQRLKTAARTDAVSRKAHRRAIAEKHGPDRAVPIGMVMIVAGSIVGAVYYL